MTDSAEQDKTGPGAKIDAEAIRRFIRDRMLGDADALTVENISFGHSNEVHLVRFDGKLWTLRRPPRGPLLPTAHDVLREYRVLKALQGTPVPLPRVYASCEDTSYIGAPFFLMEYMQGQVIRSPLLHPDASVFADTPAKRRAVSEELVDVLVRLHAVDWRAVGLEGFGRPDGYLQRQLRRWTDQLERTLPHTRPLPLMKKIAQWLNAHVPGPQPATIVHGDYKLDNLMFDSSGERPRVIALFDWEMSTIGDPLADLGWMVTYWSDPADSVERSSVIASIVPVEGYLTRREMIDRYESKSGRTMRDLSFYEVFSLFKLGIIQEGSYSRFLRGQADDPEFAKAEHKVPALSAIAWKLCEQGR